MATSGTSILRTFATAAELNEWWAARDTRGRYFCRLYDREKHIDILGSRYMFLEPEERFSDAPDENELTSHGTIPLEEPLRGEHAEQCQQGPQMGGML